MKKTKILMLTLLMLPCAFMFAACGAPPPEQKPQEIELTDEVAINLLKNNVAVFSYIKYDNYKCTITETMENGSNKSESITICEGKLDNGSYTFHTKKISDGNTLQDIYATETDLSTLANGTKFQITHIDEVNQKYYSYETNDKVAIFNDKNKIEPTRYLPNLGLTMGLLSEIVKPGENNTITAIKKDNIITISLNSKTPANDGDTIIGYANIIMQFELTDNIITKITSTTTLNSEKVTGEYVLSLDKPTIEIPDYSSYTNDRIIF